MQYSSTQNSKNNQIKSKIGNQLHTVNRFWLNHIHKYDYGAHGPESRPSTTHLESIYRLLPIKPKGYTKWIDPVTGRTRRRPPLTNRLLNYYTDDERKIYFHSDGDQQTICLMLDLDRHKPYQTQADCDEAAGWLDRMLERRVKWVKSTRGSNGYTLVHKGNTSGQKANQIAVDLQSAVKRWLALMGNCVDFEIKGTCTGLDGEGQVYRGCAGKLPLHLPEWTSADSNKLRTMQRINIETLVQLTNYLNRLCDEYEDPQPAARKCSKTCRASIPTETTQPDQSDAFVRQKQALWHLAQQLRRVPSLDKGLDFIRVQKLYRGEWEDGLSKRRARIKSILDFFTTIFDTAKLRQKLTFEVNVHGYRGWAKSKLPTPLESRSYTMDEYGNRYVARTTYLDWEFLAASMACIEHGLRKRNKDGSLPQARIKAVFQSLNSDGLAPAWCPYKFREARRLLVKWGHVIIYDPDYCPNKAMRWRFGKTWFGKAQRPIANSECNHHPLSRLDKIVQSLESLKRLETVSDYRPKRKRDKTIHYSLVRESYEQSLFSIVFWSDTS